MSPVKTHKPDIGWNPERSLNEPRMPRMAVHHPAAAGRAQVALFGACTGLMVLPKY